MAKHHYLPKFYLKAFTNDDGKFFIWSVKDSKFKGNGKFFSPSSHFFLPDDNIVRTDGMPDDYLETIYSGNESRYARILEKIRAVDQGFGLDNQDVLWLNYFAGETFWRVPAQRPVISKTTGMNRLNELGVAVIDRKTHQQVDPAQFAKWVESDRGYFQRLRNVLPATNYWNLLDCNWPCTVKTFTDPFPAICSDNPVILRHPDKADPFLDDLIFPLGPNKVFFRIKDMRDVFSPNIKFYIDMLMVLQAKEYVCCIDKDHIQRLIAFYEQNFESIEGVIDFVFTHLTTSS
ncbi:DUF4238 domain-containing protein [Mucilaginibacter sp. SJ]|uniref:DUF4238 domain-containing protein n=1 Tax=Mucilaginibacter sp. SJ TaxID=3029053 RepID=UPI0023A9204F|nr:DUF4238 domain-containing protein [Mucilaginibacter sp. SJ]WEA01776.1 DUF4238 domain-containing protein [Mucilaginibacter sp. SJ]